LAAKQLLNAGAHPDESEGDRAPLTVAAERGDLPLLRLLIERGAEVNGGRESSWTPLAAAALANHADAVQLLLSAGALPDPHPSGYPLLNWLEWSGPENAQRVRVIEVLRNAGAKKQPQWWLEFRWGIACRCAGILRRIGVRTRIRQPPGPPPIPLPPGKTPVTDTVSDTDHPTGQRPA
jgi:hypothetical protein